MIDPHRFLAFFTAAFILAALPGPGMMYVLARTLGGGRRAGLLSSVGTALGGSVHILAAATGLSALMAASAVAFSVVKYAGAAFLIYLGLRTLLSRESQAREVGELPNSQAVFRQAVVTEVLNPKTALFFLAFIPQFVDPSRGAVFVQFLLLGTVSVVLNSLADGVVALLAGALARRLRTSSRFHNGQRMTSGLALIVLGTYAAVER